MPSIRFHALSCRIRQARMPFLLSLALAWAIGTTKKAASDDGPVARAAIARLTTDGHFKQRPAWSPDGRRLVFARHADDTIWLFLLDPETGEEHRLTKRDAPEYDADWSPDGQRLAFGHVAQTPGQGDVDLHTIKPDGSDDQLVAGNINGLSHQEWPSWSPDGQRIYFTSTSPGNQEVMAAAPDGGSPRQLTQHLGIDAHPACSPDGRQIAFATDRWGGLEIAVMQADGSQVQRLTESAGLDDYPAWSPDGGRLAFVSNRDGNYEIYVMQADGSQPGNVTQSPAMDTFPTWTRDGQGITFVSDRDEQFEIYTLKVE
ncbi:MAG: TolB family protein [Pirellulales bacterium]